MKLFALMRDEILCPCFWRDVLCELVGTFFLLVAHTAIGLRFGSTEPIPLVVPGLGTAFTVFAIVEATAGMSGGLINPAVTLSFLAAGVITPIRALIFCIAELTGGIAGVALMYTLTPQEYQKQIGPLDLRPGVAAWQGFICEFLQGALLMFVAITVFDGKNRTVRLPALAIGAAVGANIMIFDKYTGASMNPAVVFSVAVVAGHWDNHWVYWAGPIAGGMVGACVYRYIMAVLTQNFRPPPEKTHMDKLRLLRETINDLVAHPDGYERKQRESRDEDEKKAPLMSSDDI